jgi:quercetin 2,3-dioxygenase
VPTPRSVRGVFASQATLEGAGVRLHRGFGFGREELFDPFLLLDEFSSDDPRDYVAGFPWHPHRGIETITYVTRGEVEHADSLGNSGRIGAGDVQWMTAGSGVIHQEMPEGDSGGRLGGFQLWTNLPASHKMMDPRYRSISASEIPAVETDDSITRVICGEVQGVKGPVRDIIASPEYLDVTLRPGATWTHPTTLGHTVFVYLFEGAACFGPDTQHAICDTHGSVVLFRDGEEVTIRTGESGVRFLFVSGAPLGEPIAWGGPIVMNTREELQRALEEYRNGDFVKHGRGRPFGHPAPVLNHHVRVS